MFESDCDLDDEDESLDSRRLTFRIPSAADAAELARLADNIKVAANLASMPNPYTRADADAWIARAAAPRERSGEFLLRLRSPAAELVGGVGYKPAEDGGPGVEIGYWIGEPFWGSGLATEAAQRLLDHIFRNPEIRVAHAACRVTNNASRRVIEKCGFQWAGTGLARFVALGGMTAVDRYRLDRSIWCSIKAWGAAGAARTR